MKIVPGLGVPAIGLRRWGEDESPGRRVAQNTPPSCQDGVIHPQHAPDRKLIP